MRSSVSGGNGPPRVPTRKRVWLPRASCAGANCCAICHISANCTGCRNCCNFRLRAKPCASAYSFGAPMGLHPLVAPLGWNLSEALGFCYVGRAVRGHKGTRTPREGSSWPHGHPLFGVAPTWLPPTGRVWACHGHHWHPLVLAPTPSPACLLRASGLPTFHGLPLSRSHARPHVLWCPPGAYMGLTVH